MRRYGLPLLFVVPLVALFVVPVVSGQPVKRLRPPIGGGATVSKTLSDAESLKVAGLKEDDAESLLGYFKARTLTETDQNAIDNIIKKFDDDDFEARLKATDAAAKFGPAAIGPLKAAQRDGAPEVAYRATQALKQLEKVPHAQVAIAAVRALVKLKTKEAAATLLGFLPLADTDEVAEAIRTALVALADVSGKADPALVAALTDKVVARRSAAYQALIEGGDKNERIRFKDVHAKVKDAVRKETDLDAKFQGLWSLLLTSREKEFVPDLIELLPKLPRGRLWQTEELLVQIAGKDKPDAKFGKTEESLTKAKDVWNDWWTKNSGSIDLAKAELKLRITGYSDFIEYDYNFGFYRIVTLGPDMKEKVKIGGNNANMLNYPTDMKRLPNGNYLIAEMNSSRITERDSTGKILKDTGVVQPLNICLLPDGGMIAVCYGQVTQFDKDMKQQWSYPRQQAGIMGGVRMPNGEVAIIANQVQPDGSSQYAIVRVEAKETGEGAKKKWEVKEVGKPLIIGLVEQYQSIDVTGDNKILVCEQQRVAEYDLSKVEKDKEKEKPKLVWSYNTRNGGASSCQRLPNGNTLIAMLNERPHGKVVEVDESGEVQWEYAPSENQYHPARAYRR